MAEGLRIDLQTGETDGLPEHEETPGPPPPPPATRRTWPEALGK